MEAYQSAQTFVVARNGGAGNMRLVLGYKYILVVVLLAIEQFYYFG